MTTIYTSGSPSRHPAFVEVSKRLAEIRQRLERDGYVVNSPIPSRAEVALLLHDASCPTGPRCTSRPHVVHTSQAVAVLAVFDVLTRPDPDDAEGP